LERQLQFLLGSAVYGTVRKLATEDIKYVSMWNKRVNACSRCTNTKPQNDISQPFLNIRRHQGKKPETRKCGNQRCIATDAMPLLTQMFWGLRTPAT